MKIPPDEQRIMERMAPGVLSLEGFLGQDNRSLVEIIQADQAVVDELGVEHERIAEALSNILVAAQSYFGSPVQVGQSMEALWTEAMGGIPCPFGGCGSFPKGEVHLTDVTSGDKVLFTPLSIHLIQKHGFYEGTGSRYRIEPRTICRMLKFPPHHRSS